MTYIYFFFSINLYLYSSRGIIHLIFIDRTFKNCQPTVPIIYDPNTTEREFIATSANGFAMTIFHYTLIISVTY